MANRWSAIIPKQYLSAARAENKVNGLLLDIAETAGDQLGKYPPFQPWKRPPKTGLRAGGRRTGNLRSGWGYYTLVSGRSVTLENKVPYAPYVQGQKGVQARALALRGWARVDDVAHEAVRVAVARFRGY